MSRARRRALLILAAAISPIAAFAVCVRTRRAQPLPPAPASKRPALLLLTSLPLVFGEDFSLQGGGSPALQALETRYRVVPISVTDPAELAKGRLLLMAQPLAQPAEDLVALDQWVRARRARAAACRSDARMAEQAPARRSAAAAADVHGHRPARALGPAARRARRARRQECGARRLTM